MTPCKYIAVNVFCHFFLFFSMQGSAIDRILGEIVHSKPLTSPIDYVLCIGHFLEKVKPKSFHSVPFPCFTWK